MFGRAVKKAVQRVVSELPRPGLSATLKDLVTETLQQIDDDNVLEELGDDLGRGLLDRRYIVTEPTEIEVEVFKFKIKFKIKIKIKAMRFNLHRRKLGEDSLEFPEE